MSNFSPIRVALKTLHDKLIEEDTKISLLGADLALLMAVGDSLNVEVDYNGLCAAIVDGDHQSLDQLRTRLTEELASKRYVHSQRGQYFDPWGDPE